MYLFLSPFSFPPATDLCAPVVSSWAAVLLTGCQTLVPSTVLHSRSTWEVDDAPSQQQCFSRVHYAQRQWTCVRKHTLPRARTSPRCYKSPRRIGCDYCCYPDCYHRLPSRPLWAEHFPPARFSQLSTLFTLMWAGGNIAERRLP